ncbi:hypothetical protein DFJ74DRAFT_359720 [Hyaloraphidium curvatum]|nr:hypothetical protein DFJ74DRAFT_359720 [Hyaloraphidium curvatum]
MGRKPAFSARDWVSPGGKIAGASDRRAGPAPAPSRTMEIEIKSSGQGPVPRPFYGPPRRTGPSLKPDAPASPDANNADLDEVPASCFAAAPGKGLFSLGGSAKPIPMELGRMIGERDAAVSEANQLLTTVKKLRDAKKRIMTDVIDLQKTASTQSAHIADLTARLADLQAHCKRLEAENADLRRMITQTTTVASRNIDHLHKEPAPAPLIQRRERGSLLALKRAKDMEKEVLGEGVSGGLGIEAPPESGVFSRKVSRSAPSVVVLPPLPEPGKETESPVETADVVNRFSLMLEDALRTPPESRVVSRMASRCFSFKIEQQKIVESLSIQSGDIAQEDVTNFLSSTTLFGDEEKAQADSFAGDLERALNRIQSGEDLASQPQVEQSRVKALISTFTTVESSPTKRPKGSTAIFPTNYSALVAGTTFGPSIQRERTAEKVRMERQQGERERVGGSFANRNSVDASAKEFFRILDELDTVLGSQETINLR